MEHKMVPVKRYVPIAWRGEIISRQYLSEGEGASPLDLLLQRKKKFPKAPPVSTTTKEPEEKKKLSIRLFAIIEAKR